MHCSVYMQEPRCLLCLSIYICLCRDKFLKNIYLFWLCWVVVSACGIFLLRCSIWTCSCGMWDLVPWPGIEPKPPVLGAWSLSHWTTRDFPVEIIFAFAALIFLKAEVNHSGESTMHREVVRLSEKGKAIHASTTHTCSLRLTWLCIPLLCAY